MSNLVVCNFLAKSFGAQLLFKGVDLVIHSGDRVGLIGPNGSGKSTLLKIICGLEDSDEGTVTVRRHVKISYLAQTDIFDDELSVVDNLYNSLSGQGLDEVERHNRVSEMLSRAEFSQGDQPVKLLSGGWRKRLSICRALLAGPDLMVLDEPTNHLDIEGIIWLEKLILSGLAGGPSAFLLVSHDRQFLENCANRVVELSSLYPEGSLQVNGSYSTFQKAREVYLERQLEMENRLSNKVRRENEWLDRGPKARTTKARYRIEEAHRLQNELAQVRGRNKSIANVDIEFGGTGRKTRKLLEARKISKSYSGKKLFSDLDIILSPGLRLGLLGRNGCGKSTLMEILAAGDGGSRRLDSGSIKTAGNVKIVHFDQKRAMLDTSLTLRRALAPEGDSVVFQGRSIHVVSWAKRFLFRADQLETPVKELSGGEQARILIASLMLQPADILLLDEPTNDLDIGSLDVLEESLAEFAGALILVTHDRFLLNRVCDRVLGFDGTGEVAFYADYHQWLNEVKSAPAEALDGSRGKPLKHSSTDAGESKKRPKSGKLSYLDQREYDQLEGKIEGAEVHQEQLEERLNDPALAADPEKLEECWQELEAVKKEIEILYDRWEELESKKDS